MAFFYDFCSDIKKKQFEPTYMFPPPARWGPLEFNKGATPSSLLLLLLFPPTLPPTPTFSPLLLVCSSRSVSRQWVSIVVSHLASSGCCGARLDPNPIPSFGCSWGCSCARLHARKNVRQNAIMPEKMSHRMSNIYIYTYIFIYIYTLIYIYIHVCHILYTKWYVRNYVRIVCQGGHHSK